MAERLASWPRGDQSTRFEVVCGELPGGKIDAGESAADAARREVQEELQIDIVPRESLGVAEDIDENQCKEKHVHVEVVLADLASEEPRESDRLWKWIPIAPTARV